MLALATHEVHFSILREVCKCFLHFSGRNIYLIDAYSRKYVCFLSLWLLMSNVFDWKINNLLYRWSRCQGNKRNAFPVVKLDILQLNVEVLRLMARLLLTSPFRKKNIRWYSALETSNFYFPICIVHLLFFIQFLLGIY